MTVTAKRKLTKEQQAYADIGAELLFGKSFEQLEQEARESGVALTEERVQAIIRTGRRQGELGLSK